MTRCVSGLCQKRQAFKRNSRLSTSSPQRKNVNRNRDSRKQKPLNRISEVVVGNIIDARRLGRLQPRRSTVRYKTNDVLTVGGYDTADAASLPSHRVRTLRPAHHNLHIRSGRRAALRDVHPTGLAGPITATTATPVHDPRATGRGAAKTRRLLWIRGYGPIDEIGSAPGRERVGKKG